MNGNKLTYGVEIPRFFSTFSRATPGVISYCLPSRVERYNSTVYTLCYSLYTVRLRAPRTHAHPLPKPLYIVSFDRPKTDCFIIARVYRTAKR